MNFKKCLVVITDSKDTVSIYFPVGGQPHAFANTFATAIAGARRGITARRLLLLLANASPSSRVRLANFYYGDSVWDNDDIDYLYEISIPGGNRPLKLEVGVIVSDLKKKESAYRGTVEAFVNRQFRFARKPRGRTPAGYRSRAEYEEACNLRRLNSDTAPNRVDFESRAAILADRRNSPSTRIDLQGAREFTPAERIVRRKKK